MCQEQTDPFSVACNAIPLQPNLQRSASHSLVGWSTLRPRLTRHPASPRPHAANEENAALRKAIKDADYECGVGLLRLNQLDLVTVVALPATVRRSATVPSPQEQLISQSGLPQCVRLSFTGREEEQLCLQHCPWTTTQPGRGQRLAGGDDKHSQPNAELAKGRQVRMPHARPSTRRRRGWTSSATEWRCSTRTAAMAPRCQPYVPPHTPATVGGAWAALHDLTPHLLSIASSGSPECRMRCAIAHF